MRRHVASVESTWERRTNTTSPKADNGIPLPANKNNRGTQHHTPRFISTKVASIFGSIALVFLLWVHIFLAQVLLINEPRLIKEFTFPGDHPSVVDASVVSRGEQQHQPRTLTPLRSPLDYDLYTIRMNSWKRLELLETSIRHHSSCPGVAQIQVVWCDEQGDPPASLLENDKVVIERHAINSLNERFRILEEPPTMGILSMDDDVLRPCEAIDTGFFKWVQNPERMVGFDGRGHSIAKKRDHDEEPIDDPKVVEWGYAYLSETERYNHYSITLPRYAFLHRDYLYWYMDILPKPIFNKVAENFNCEDIAMSFFVSSLTDGKPPLLADKWAIRMSQVKLYTDKGGISNSNNHKKVRDACVDSFADILNLKGRLHHAKYMRHGFYHCGAAGRTSDEVHSERQREFVAMKIAWATMEEEDVIREMLHMKERAAIGAFHDGLMEDTKPWETRWGMKSKKHKS
jgi:glucuronyl/N-acetylglucosaminyl transferase EXT2